MDAPGIQSGALELNGSSNFEFDAQVKLPSLDVAREYHLSYAAEYASIRAQTAPKRITSGNVHYTVNAVRKASSRRGEREAHFAIGADLTFNNNGTATLVLDGSHRYTVNLVIGGVSATR